jgi:hypothetical protein
VALGGLMQLIWPSASAGVFVLITVGYLFWVKRQGWSIAPKVTDDGSQKEPRDLT